MKLKHFAKMQKRRVFRLMKNRVKALSKPVARLERKIKRVSALEVRIAFYLLHKILKRQLRIRPRIRFILVVILLLSIFYLSSKQAVDFIKPQEDSIRINGHVITLSEGENLVEAKQVSEVDQVVMPKLSPFEFKQPVRDALLSQGYSAYHRANDIAAPFNSVIYPLGAGVVEFAGAVSDGKGNIVLIDHGNGLKTLYAHMNRVEVGTGNKVDTNSVLGTIGLTGHTTGPHVHLEVYNEGVAIDPSSVLPEN